MKGSHLTILQVLKTNVFLHDAATLGMLIGLFGLTQKRD